MTQLSLKETIAKDFNKSAEQYAQKATIQKDSNDLLFQMFRYNYSYKTSTFNILDVGAGTGFLKEAIAHKKSFPKRRLFELDLSHGMCEETNKNNYDWSMAVNADYDALPFADRTIDIIFANMSLHWSENIQHTLKHLVKTLKPKGMFVACIPVAGSFNGLYKTFKHFELDHILPKQCYHEKFTSSCRNAGLNIAKKELRDNIQIFNKIIDIFTFFKETGTTQKHHLPHPLSKSLITSMEQYYLDKYCTNNLLTLNWKLCYIVGTKPAIK